MRAKKDADPTFLSLESTTTHNKESLIIFAEMVSYTFSCAHSYKISKNIWGKNTSKDSKI